MPIPAGFNVTGTPITNVQGVGGSSGNAITISGLSIQPGQPGFSLTSFEGGPGFVSGRWTSGPFATIAARGGMPDTPGWTGQPGTSGGGGGGMVYDEESAQFIEGQSGRLTLAGWAALALFAVAALDTLKGKR
jgi:hypothetical protein